MSGNSLLTLSQTLHRCFFFLLYSCNTIRFYGWLQYLKFCMQLACGHTGYFDCDMHFCLSTIAWLGDCLRNILNKDVSKCTDHTPNLHVSETLHPVQRSSFAFIKMLWLTATPILSAASMSKHSFPLSTPSSDRPMLYNDISTEWYLNNLMTLWSFAAFRDIVIISFFFCS